MGVLVLPGRRSALVSCCWPERELEEVGHRRKLFEQCAELAVQVFALRGGKRLQRRPGAVRVLELFEIGRHVVEALVQRREQAGFTWTQQGSDGRQC